MNNLILRKVKPEDSFQIWGILELVIREGSTYVFDPNSSKEKMMDYWLSEDKHTYVAELEGEVVGTFYLKANQPDRGSHIANAGYMVSPKAAGKGVGKALAAFSFEEAKRLGFQAMQFNYVVKTNTIAVDLWKKMGFDIVGEIPKAFDHPDFGLTNVYVMHREL